MSQAVDIFSISLLEVNVWRNWSFFTKGWKVLLPPILRVKQGREGIFTRTYAQKPFKLIS